MSGPDVKKLDPFIIALGSVGNATDVSKQQLVDILTLVINGKITQSWEQSNGMTREKTELIEAKRALSELPSNGLDDADGTFRQAIQDIIMKLSIFKREAARMKAQQNAPGGDDTDDDDEEDDDGAIPPLNDDGGAVDGGPVDAYDDYSSSN